MPTTQRARLRWLTIAVTIACGGGGERTPAATPAQQTSMPESTPPSTLDAAASNAPDPALPIPPPIGDAPLPNGLPSLAALGQAVVEALAANDRQALWALSVSESEYTRLFGALVSHPHMLRFGPKLAWASQLEDNRDAVREVLAEHGGKGYAFVSLEPTTRVERNGLMLYRDPTLTVKDASGSTLEAKVIEVAVEHVATHTFLVLTFAD